MANGFGNGGFGRTTEPDANRWHDLKLGSSFKNQKSKFCTLRYEFKPASIDKTQPGSLHKSKENRVTVEFHNNQPGKPKVSFEGSSEEHKELDGVLFFDGEEFKLEKLNRAFKSLKHKRVPGESNLTGTSTNGESHSPPLTKVARTQNINRPSTHAVPVEMERIDIGEPENTGTRPTTNKPTNSSYQYQPTNTNTNPDPFSPSSSNQDQDSPLDILGNSKSSPPIPAVGFDINVPTNQDFDDEINIAFDDDFDNNNHEGGMSAAEALMRAQQQQGEGNGDVQLENREREAETSSSGGGSSSSGSSSGSGSGSSSESDAADSASSGDVDVF